MADFSELSELQQFYSKPVVNVKKVPITPKIKPPKWLGLKPAPHFKRVKPIF